MSFRNCQQSGNNSATCKNEPVARVCDACGPNDELYDDAFNAGYEAARNDARMMISAGDGNLDGWLSNGPIKTEAA